MGLIIAPTRHSNKAYRAMFQLMRYYVNELDRNTVTSVRDLWSESDDAECIVKIMEEICPKD